VKVFANASAAAPPAVYFAKTFTDYSALKFIYRFRQRPHRVVIAGLPRNPLQ
jgi:hypothetical protein